MQRLLKFTLDLFAPTAPVISRHPDSTQQTNINGQLIDYRLMRSRRRTMIFSVSAEGLAVRAPYGMPMHTVEQAVQEKGRWIVRKLGGMQERQARVDASRINWLDTPQLDFLGKKIGIIIDVANFGAGDIIEIRFNNDTEEMFPFTKEFFPEIGKDYVVFKNTNVVQNKSP